MVILRQRGVGVHSSWAVMGVGRDVSFYILVCNYIVLITDYRFIYSNQFLENSINFKRRGVWAWGGGTSAIHG